MTFASGVAAFFQIVLALLKLAAAGADYARVKEAGLAARQKVLLSLFEGVTEKIDAAKKAELEFDSELRADPSSLFKDDGYKRHSNQIRAPTDASRVE
ncbi:hypothetical protein [uncultured Cohaesibacter sp.]|uniref:hypothetical protein n=1 Tax=uncultured Cohaesibacter sp. TaxID=1002546 RepID=UPI002AAACB31|nr:hypothetical protein [uncultured Cohaesibacter sp.]